MIDPGRLELMIESENVCFVEFRLMLLRSTYAKPHQANAPKPIAMMIQLMVPTGLIR